MHVQLPNSATLCTRCTDLLPLLIDISPTPKLGTAALTQWWDQTYGKIPYIQNITDESCELCHILRKAFTGPSGFDPADTRIKVSNRTLSKHKGLEHNACSFATRDARLVLAPGVVPTVTTDDGEPVQAFTARPVLKLLNPLLVKFWIAMCLQHTTCKPDYSAADFDFPFRVIDVQEGRLVEAPPDVRYVALSYVWGGVKQVMLNKTNREFLERKGSITSEGLQDPTRRYSHIQKAMETEGRVIPRTIRDAIRLCLLVGERYLWTDSLCIMQDDDFQDPGGAWTNSDKMAQIPKMNIIYGASLLTIVAACGADSNAGLPGVHEANTRTTQIMGHIGDQVFLSIHNDPMDAFWKSRWGERAWTFQEFLLSKRHLIFLPEQVVFHCHRCTWSEDHSLEFVEEKEIGSAPAWTHCYQLSPLQLPDRSRWGADVYFPAIFFDQYYSQWLKNFLKRRLTVPSDILFAFDGALSASKQHLGTFHQGLPIDYFSEALTWSVGTSSTYLGKDLGRGLTERRPGFPSWSWTGWMWNVADFEEFRVYNGTKGPEYWDRVGIWRATASDDGNIELDQLTTPGMEGWGQLGFSPFDDFQVDDKWIRNQLPTYLEAVRRSPIPSNCLVIKTLTASILVNPERQGQYSSSLKAFSAPGSTPEDLVGGLSWPNKWLDQIRDGQQLQMIITVGSFFGRSTKFPDQTDEMDPSIACLVVKEVDDGQFERLTKFVAPFSQMKKLQWKPIVAVLR